jgi:hypothetical protein
MMVLGTVAFLPPVLLHAPALQAAAAESERQSDALPAIKNAILKTTGYADASVTLALKANRFCHASRRLRWSARRELFRSCDLHDADRDASVMAVAAFIELPAAVPTPEPMIALCCQVWPLGHRRRATAYAIHRNQPPPRGILGKLIRWCQPRQRGARRDRTY